MSLLSRRKFLTIAGLGGAGLLSGIALPLADGKAYPLDNALPSNVWGKEGENI